MDAILNLAPVALFTFGAVWFLDLVLSRYTTLRLDSQHKFILSVVIAFALGYVPSDLGLDIANRAKEAVGIAGALAGLYQGLRKIV